MSDSQLDSTIRKRRLKIEDRHAIAEWLLKESKNGVVKHGSLNQAVILFNTSRSTVERIWQQTIKCR